MIQTPINGSFLFFISFIFMQKAIKHNKLIIIYI